MKTLHKIIVMIVLSGFLFSEKRIQLIQVYSFDSLTSYPTDIVGSPDGTIYVLDGVNNRILVIDNEFNTSYIYPNDNTILESVGIGYDNGLWIADTPRNRLCKINLNGSFEKILPLKPTHSPVDIVFNKKNIFYSERNNHIIGIIDKTINSFKQIGLKGKHLGEFSFPGPIMLFENNLIISDILNGRVVGYSLHNSINFLIANFGIEVGKVFRPKGIAIDKNKNVWIADSYTGYLQIFSFEGEFIDIASIKNEYIYFNSPTGIWIDQLSRIWVVESIINKVSVWNIIDE